MGQKASVSARGQGRERLKANARDPSLDLARARDPAPDGCSGSAATDVVCQKGKKPIRAAMRRWRRKVLGRLPFLIGGPLRRASRRALRGLRHVGRSRRLRSGRDVASASMPLVPPSNAEVSRRGREAYLGRLGIRRHANGFATRRLKYRDSRSTAPGSLSEGLAFVVEEAARNVSTSTLSSIQTGNSASVLSRQLSSTLTVDSSEDPFAGSEIFASQTSPDHQARMKFLQKLSYQRVWIPKAQRPPSHQTLIIFDWDDTLLCTSFLNLVHAANLSASVKRALKELEKLVISLLEKALRLGQTFIITNAVSGWVEQSAAEYIPGVLPVLQRVNVVSARSRYESEYPNQVSKWKAETFLEVQRQLDSQVITNLVSLGDSHFEMEATLAMGREFEQATIKTIKFKESPSPEELWRQQELVCKEFERIIGDARDLRVRILAPHNRPEPCRILDPKSK
mmetsp:Transcript_95376/g.179354  ORF Transcript_95376/g.179354 Transcript_95376/m.179354 type:complete len:454 (+) Transcript_95376:87-1448(+)